MFRNVSELLELTEKHNKPISEIMIEQEIDVTGRSREDIIAKMQLNLKTMEEAVKRGIEEDVVSVSGLTGGDGKKISPLFKTWQSNWWRYNFISCCKRNGDE